MPLDQWPEDEPLLRQLAIEQIAAQELGVSPQKGDNEGRRISLGMAREDAGRRAIAKGVTCEGAIMTTLKQHIGRDPKATFDDRLRQERMQMLHAESACERPRAIQEIGEAPHVQPFSWRQVPVV